MLIVNIPIEPIEMRYSKDWGKWFKEELDARHYDYFNIVPIRSISKTVTPGQFLDAITTMNYKAQQMDTITQMVNVAGGIERDTRVVFLIHDGWFPVEQIAYMRDMLGCHDWRIVGLFHAGTYDPWDQLTQHGMYTYGRDLENAWFKIYDKIIVASEYHRQLILESRNVAWKKVVVIPWKVEVPKDLLNTEKHNFVIFPHRYAPEKQCELFNELIVPKGWWKQSTQLDCVLNKRSFYESLAESKICVSFSLQETFGISMFESVLLGCIPLVPDRLAYREYYPECFRYKDMDEFEWMLNEMCTKDGYEKGELIRLKEGILASSERFFTYLFKEIESV